MRASSWSGLLAGSCRRRRTRRRTRTAYTAGPSRCRDGVGTPHEQLLTTTLIKAPIREQDNARQQAEQHIPFSRSRRPQTAAKRSFMLAGSLDFDRRRVARGAGVEVSQLLSRGARTTASVAIYTREIEFRVLLGVGEARLFAQSAADCNSFPSLAATLTNNKSESRRFLLGVGGLAGLFSLGSHQASKYPGQYSRRGPSLPPQYMHTTSVH